VGLGRADRADLLLLEHPEQLGLERRRQLGDLVEEEGATVRRAEQPQGVGDCAGEGLVFVSGDEAGAVVCCPIALSVISREAVIIHFQVRMT